MNSITVGSKTVTFAEEIYVMVALLIIYESSFYKLKIKRPKKTSRIPSFAVRCKKTGFYEINLWGNNFHKIDGQCSFC